jgi:hypothetical protein
VSWERSWGGAGAEQGGAAARARGGVRVCREWNERGAKAGRGRRRSGVERQGSGGGAEAGRSGGGADAGQSGGWTEAALGIPVATEKAVDVDPLTGEECGAAGCCRALQSYRLGRT